MRGLEVEAVYRRRIIERAFRHSEQHGYFMPRVGELGSEGDSEEIPNIYDLYSQNKLKSRVKIIPVQQLAKLQPQSTSTLQLRPQ
jgi:hypothetical protein